MARIISIIPKRRLVTYKTSNNHRACAYHDYEVFIELDNGKVRVIPVDDYWDIDGNTAQEILDENMKDDVKPFDAIVTINLFEQFVSALLEEGDSPLGAIRNVLFTLKESGCKCSDDVEKLIENAYPNIP